MRGWRGVPILFLLGACTAFGASDPSATPATTKDAGALADGGLSTDLDAAGPHAEGGDGGAADLCVQTVPPFDDFEVDPSLDGWEVNKDSAASAGSSTAEKYCGQASLFVSTTNGGTADVVRSFAGLPPVNHVIWSVLVNVTSVSDDAVEFAKLIAHDAHFYFELRNGALQFTERNENIPAQEDMHTLLSSSQVTLGQWIELYADLTVGLNPSVTVKVGPPGAPVEKLTAALKYDSGGPLTSEQLGVSGTGSEIKFAAYFDRDELTPMTQ